MKKNIFCKGGGRLRINLSASAGVVWTELPEIYQKVIRDINHSNFILLTEFTSYPSMDLYQEQIENIFMASRLFLEKIEDLQRYSMSTSKKINDYCLHTLKNKPQTNDLLTQLSQQLNSNLTPINSEPVNVFEKREAGELDLLTLLNQQLN